MSAINEKAVNGTQLQRTHKNLPPFDAAAYRGVHHQLY